MNPIPSMGPFANVRRYLNQAGDLPFRKQVKRIYVVSPHDYVARPSRHFVLGVYAKRSEAEEALEEILRSYPRGTNVWRRYREVEEGDTANGVETFADMDVLGLVERVIVR